MPSHAVPTFTFDSLFVMTVFPVWSNLALFSAHPLYPPTVHHRQHGGGLPRIPLTQAPIPKEQPPSDR